MSGAPVKLRVIQGGEGLAPAATERYLEPQMKGDKAGTLVPHVHRWINGRVGRREITVDTARRYRTVVLSFAYFYGQRPVRNLSRRDVERWIETRGHLARGTLRNDVNQLRSFLTWMQREKHIGRHPMLDIRTPKVPRSVPRALRDDEVRRLWNALPDLRARAIITLMLGLGLRRGEVLALQVGDWDRWAQVMTVTGKGGHQRQLPVLPAYAVHLERYLDSIGVTAGPMIRTEDGTRPISNNWLGTLVAGWMRDAGVKHRPLDGKACHALRHTAISELADAEPDVRVLQDFAGHVHLSSTQIYLRRVGLARIREAMEARREAHVSPAIAAVS